MENDINLLDTLYQNVQMGIVGIDDVIDKAKHPDLKKELKHQKNNYQDYLKKIKKMLEKYEQSANKIGLLAKISSKMYSEMKLMKDDSDHVIIKMMIEGIYKSIGVLKTKKLEYNTSSNNILQLLDDFSLYLETCVKKLQKISKVC